MPYMSTDDYHAYFQYLSDNGFRWIRFYVHHRDFDFGDAMTRLSTVLNLMAQYSLLAVVVFTDSLGASGYNITEDLDWHNQGMGHLHKTWYKERYKVHYMPRLATITSIFKNHPAVGLWQLINEPGMYPYNPPDINDIISFKNFVDDASGLVYANDGFAPVSIGAITWKHFLPATWNYTQVKSWYGDRKHVQAITNHTYQQKTNISPLDPWAHQAEGLMEAQIANETGRVHLITEFGSQNSPREIANKTYMNSFYDANSTACLQWGFSINDYDKGISDKIWGIAPWLKGDFDIITALYRTF